MSDLLNTLQNLIKQLEDINTLAEFATLDHHLSLTEKSGVFFVHLDSASVFASNDPKEAVTVFYEEISRIHEDEEKGVDPEFSTLREILLSRNKFIQEKLEQLDHKQLARSLSFLKFNDDFTAESLSRTISNNLRVLEMVKYRPSDSEGIECHTCDALTRDSFCTRIGMPVDEEYVCNLYKTMPGAKEAEEYAKITEQPYEEKAVLAEKRKRPMSQTPITSETPPEDPAILTQVPKPNNTEHSSSSMDDKRFYMKKAEDVQLSAKAIILDSENNILVLKDSGSSFIDIPGGHIQDNETIEEGLKREVYEETHLYVTSCKQLFTKNLALGNPPRERPVVIFIASVVGEIQLSSEHTEYLWVSVPNLHVLNLGVFLPVIYEALDPDILLQKQPGHNMEVTDLGQPFYNHHEPSAWDMGEPNLEVDNVQTLQHENPGTAAIRQAHLDKKELRHPKAQSEIPYVPDTPESISIKMSNGQTYTINSLRKYSEAGTKEDREKPYIESDHQSSVSYEAGNIGAFGSAADVDKQNGGGGGGGAAGGVGSAGEGSGSTGSAGVLTTSTTFTPTYGGGGKKKRKEYNSTLSQKQQAHEIGTSETTGYRPDYDVYEYNKEIRDKNSPRNPKLPAHQQALGEAEQSNIWLEGDKSPNTRLLPESSRKTTYDEAAEQYTNLSMDLINPLLRKSADTPELLKNEDRFTILSPGAFKKAQQGKSLVVAGWGSYYVVDREGHRISLDGLNRAIKRFLSRPEYANMNLFHSGIQIGRIIPSFTDESGKVWKTEVKPEGLFVIAEFRTDLEVSRKAMVEVLSNNLRGFSIAGNAEEKTVMCDGGHCWEEVTELEIYECTLCVTPMNQGSYITDILQIPDNISCPECYTSSYNTAEYDSSLQPIH
jgi:8-oxo-dGTP diphosphatase